MAQLLCPPEMQTGMDQIDALHQDIFDALGQLSAATGKSFIRCYGILVSKLEHVFATEEEWMEAIHYSELKRHREQHARMLAALHVVHSQVLDNNIALGRKVTQDLLPQWLSMHIPAMDAPLACALQEAGLPRGQPVLPPLQSSAHLA